MNKELVAPAILIDKITLTNIVMLKCGVDSTNQYQEQPLPPEKIVISLGTSSAFDLENRNCRFRLHITLEGQNVSGTALGLDAEFLMDYFFVIENLTDFLIQQKEETQIHGILGATLLGISFSTSRGIVLERTKGTPFAGFILPVINPSQALFSSSIKQISATTVAEPKTTYQRKKANP